MKHPLRNIKATIQIKVLLYRLKRQGKAGRKAKKRGQELHDTVDKLRGRLPLYTQFQNADDKAKFAKEWNENLMAELELERQLQKVTPEKINEALKKGKIKIE